MATYSWINNSSSSTLSWSNTSNWSTGTIPASGDLALVNDAGSYTINFDGSGSLGTLAVSASGATLGFSTNSVTLVNGATLTAGVLAISGGGILAGRNSSSLLVNGGTLSETGGTAAFGGAGSISSGLVTLSAGQFTVGGSLIVSGGTFTLAGANSSLSNAQFNAGGIVAFSSGSLTSSGTVGIGSGESVTIGGARISATSGIVNAGTIAGIGTIASALSGSGLITANSGSGGTLVISAATGVQQFQINNGSVLQFGSSVASGDAITFNGASGEVLSLADPTANEFSGTISGFVSGDSIVVRGAVSYISSGTTVQAWSGTGGTGSVLATINSTSALGTRTENTSAFTVCFAAGSRIRTEQGDIAVEALVEGQRVAVLRDGAVAFTPITWIGQRRINLSAHPRPQTAAPVRICRGAVGENLPERDLLLSPDHCLFLDGKLIPAKSLINGMTIVQERALPAVHYFHVEVDPHAVLLAEGLPVESYLDTGNRAYFENCGAALVLHPEFTINAGLKAWATHACAPLTVQPEAVRPIWQRLAERAEAMGFGAPQPETTQDPDLHLVADGRAIRPMAARDGRYVFALPAGYDSVRLVSRASIPSDLSAWLDDWRPLGVAVTQVVARTLDGQRLIPADHPGLVRGWHTVETDGTTTWRWTAGNAELALDVNDGPMFLEVQVCNTARYIVKPAQQQQSLAA